MPLNDDSEVSTDHIEPVRHIIPPSIPDDTPEPLPGLMPIVQGLDDASTPDVTMILPPPPADDDVSEARPYDNGYGRGSLLPATTISGSGANLTCLPYNFDQRCPVCSLATTDEQVHLAYINNNRDVAFVCQYIDETYPERHINVSVIQNHINAHFLPSFESTDYLRMLYVQTITEQARVTAQRPPEELLAEMSEIVSQTIAELKVRQAISCDSIDGHVNVSRSIATLVNSNIKAVEARQRIIDSQNQPDDVLTQVNILVTERLKQLMDHISASAKSEVMAAYDIIVRRARDN